MQFSAASSSAAAALLLTLAVSGAARAEAMTTPSMSASLAANGSPATIDAGPLGTIHVTGAVSAIGYVQDNRVPGDHKSRGDLSNAQVFFQKNEGLVQFFAQAGAYSIPTIGVPYIKASDTTQDTFGVVPQAFVKIAPSSNFSIMAGKLPTLIGAEYTFSFQNLNIQRGLVWNQENAVNRGVQVNYSTGPISASVSVNDGFYSNRYSWVSALVAYTIDESNAIAVAGGGNLSDTGRTGTATPLAQNNSEIYNLIYTYSKGPLLVSPYIQYTRVPEIARFGLGKASSYGYALLGKYSFNDHFNLAARGEYIDTKGGATNLLYGPGSNAWSMTLTPTYQHGAFFVRGELSYVKATSVTPGSAFGAAGGARNQTRALIETGMLF